MQRNTITILILLVLSSNASAFDKIVNRGYELTFSWTQPTQYTDGSALPVSDIAYNTIYWGCDTGKKGSIKSIGALTSYKLKTNNIYGQCQFMITVTDINNLESEKPSSISILIRLNKPQTGGFR